MKTWEIVTGYAMAGVGLTVLSNTWLEYRFENGKISITDKNAFSEIAVLAGLFWPLAVAVATMASVIYGGILLSCEWLPKKLSGLIRSSAASLRLRRSLRVQSLALVTDGVDAGPYRTPAKVEHGLFCDACNRHVDTRHNQAHGELHFISISYARYLRGEIDYVTLQEFIKERAFFVKKGICDGKNS